MGGGGSVWRTETEVDVLAVTAARHELLSTATAALLYDTDLSFIQTCSSRLESAEVLECTYSLRHNPFATAPVTRSWYKPASNIN